MFTFWKFIFLPGVTYITVEVDLPKVDLPPEPPPPHSLPSGACCSDDPGRRPEGRPELRSLVEREGEGLKENLIPDFSPLAG